MPELPEVELTREKLGRWLVGKRVDRVRIPDARTRRGQSESAIRAAIEGRALRHVRRRGKFLRITFDGPGPALLNHLGMTGRWRRVADDRGDPPAARAALETDAGFRAVFLDVRRFGHCSLLLPADGERLARLGPEPLGRGFTAKMLGRLCAGSGRPVKVLLMDQDRIAGIGNIQASESLWRAGIHPHRRAGDLGPEEVVRLHRAVRRTLRTTLAEARGVELVYVSEGAKGRKSADSRFRVYGKAGSPCPRCVREAVVRTVCAGRSSFHCPRCQRPPSPC